MATVERSSVVPRPARPYQGRRAGIVTRSLAAVVDLVVVIGIVGAIYLAVAGLAFALNPTSFHWPRNFAWSLPVAGFVIAVPYLTLTWGTTGRSYGDTLFGLRIVDRTGHRPAVLPPCARRSACSSRSACCGWWSAGRTGRSRTSS